MKSFSVKVVEAEFFLFAFNLARGNISSNLSKFKFVLALLRGLDARSLLIKRKSFVTFEFSSMVSCLDPCCVLAHKKGFSLLLITFTGGTVEYES